MRPHYSQSSRENPTPSRGTSPIASCNRVPPRDAAGQRSKEEVALRAPENESNVLNKHFHFRYNLHETHVNGVLVAFEYWKSMEKAPYTRIPFFV